MSLFKRSPDEAERILLQANPPLAYRAIKMRVDLFQFTRALEIALKFNCCVEVVLFYRKRFLDTFQKSENVKEFMVQNDRFNGGNFDLKDIEQMEKDQLQDEKANSGGRRK